VYLFRQLNQYDLLVQCAQLELNSCAAHLLLLPLLLRWMQGSKLLHVHTGTRSVVAQSDEGSSKINNISIRADGQVRDTCCNCQQPLLAVIEVASVRMLKMILLLPCLHSGACAAAQWHCAHAYQLHCNPLIYARVRLQEL
jgi:hypothetical protein